MFSNTLRKNLLARSSRNHVPGPNTTGDTRLTQELVVLRRNHATDHDQDVLTAKLWCSSSISSGTSVLCPPAESRYADDVHIVLDRHSGNFAWRLEERTDVDVESHVGKCRGDHLGAAIMTVLAHLGDEDARPAPFLRSEFARPSRRALLELRVASALAEYTPEMVRVTAW